MPDERKYLKIHVMSKPNLEEKLAWDVEIPPNVWEEVYEYCNKHKECYKIQGAYRGVMRHRIWVTTLGHLMDLVQITSDELRKKPS